MKKREVSGNVLVVIKYSPENNNTSVSNFTAHVLHTQKYKTGHFLLRESIIAVEKVLLFCLSAPESKRLTHGCKLRSIPERSQYESQCSALKSAQFILHVLLAKFISGLMYSRAGLYQSGINRSQGLRLSPSVCSCQLLQGHSAFLKACSIGHALDVAPKDSHESSVKPTSGGCPS
ncbi:hypothetical protein PoB_000436600 [Plakobranchus ocellatus]|uniref:Uncharacterized protein n=1 Tax=Plakobranchus ocellatus TaxID=259542 RepID=A0AAV3Y608_9GAST|nr:hypothetical protein PoB_000436600 [Plakobranchus ocellatus]